MLILDIDYLDSVPEITSMNLGGGKAQASSAWSAVAFGKSTLVIAIARNEAIVGNRGSYASSSVKVFVIGDRSASASASSYSSASR
jgi:hypothetical protein